MQILPRPKKLQVLTLKMQLCKEPATVLLETQRISDRKVWVSNLPATKPWTGVLLIGRRLKISLCVQTLVDVGSACKRTLASIGAGTQQRWLGRQGPCTLIPLTWRMTHRNLCRMLKNVPLKIFKIIENKKKLFQITFKGSWSEFGVWTTTSYYSDDSFIRTRLFPIDISGLMSFLDYWIAHSSGRGNQFPHFLSRLERYPDYRSLD